MTQIGGDTSLPADAAQIAALRGEAADPPALVVDRLARLRLLKDVPFNYLVADPDLLPLESIRFFHLDLNWIDCLVDGAFSLGRATSGDLAHDEVAAPATHAAASAAAMPGQTGSATEQAVTGFLLRSAVVQGWPGLEATAYPRGSTTALSMLRSEHLSPTVLFCLFDGLLDRVDIHEPPEGLHFGVDLDHSGSLDYATFVKKLKPLGTQPLAAARVVGIPYRAGGRRVLDVSALAGAMSAKLAAPAGSARPPFTSAEFSFQMVEGVGLVSFVLGQPKGG